MGPWTSYQERIVAETARETDSSSSEPKKDDGNGEMLNAVPGLA